MRSSFVQKFDELLTHAISQKLEYYVQDNEHEGARAHCCYAASLKLAAQRVACCFESERCSG